MECRAPEGFGLVARTQVVISGPVPDDFAGFPGAAGGNLGGGNLIDVTPPVSDGVRIVKVEFSDGTDISTSGPIDISQVVCDAGTPADTTDDFAEPFYFNDYLVTVANDTGETVFVESVTFTINDAGTPGATSTQSKVTEIEPAAEEVIDGLLIDFSTGGPKTFAGTSDTVELGTFRVDIVVAGVTDNGDSFSVSDSVTLTFDHVNRCE
jgi:hypothetical protein